MSEEDMNSIVDDLAAQCNARNYSAATAALCAFTPSGQALLLTRFCLRMLEAGIRERSSLRNFLRDYISKIRISDV